ncbi:MAG: DUF268 domain-containing protein [Mariprofundaceae bacterium]|nr:DUF268 domain-containing protein [Mariprofundaceae bacterium]
MRAILGYFWFIRDWIKFNRLGGQARLLNGYPCVMDKTAMTTFDPQYFYQAIWGFNKILSSKVTQHVDVGSEINFVGMLSVVTHVTFVDIRPVNIQLKNFSCQEGSILSLPYGSDTIKSLSCMHVIEHIGLGRYGDPLDPSGSVKACRELERVVAVEGVLYITVPIYDGLESKIKVHFNGFRSFGIQEVISFFPTLTLCSFSMVNGNRDFIQDVDPKKATVVMDSFSDSALGLFEFTKLALE